VVKKEHSSAETRWLRQYLCEYRKQLAEEMAAKKNAGKATENIPTGKTGDQSASIVTEEEKAA
jgi:hypothetical protein